MKFGECTWPELAEHARAGAIALVPFGCTEQQGTHLPVDFDTWFAADLTTAAAARLDAAGIPTLVLPVVPFGPTPEHRNFGAGYIDLPVNVHEAVALAAISSLAQQGFTTIVLWRGCGGHDLQPVITQARTQWPEIVLDLPTAPLNQIWAEQADPSVAGGHADSFTTSICLYRWPESVRLDRIPAPSAAPDWDDPALDFAKYTDQGTIGDARHASAALGASLWDATVTWIVNHIQTLAQAA